MFFLKNGKIYPNPTFDKLFLDKIYLFNTNGKLLKTQEQISEIDLSHYNKGVYYIKLINSDKKLKSKKKFDCKQTLKVLPEC